MLQKSLKSIQFVLLLALCTLGANATAKGGGGGPPVGNVFNLSKLKVVGMPVKNGDVYSVKVELTSDSKCVKPNVRDQRPCAYLIAHMKKANHGYTKVSFYTGKYSKKANYEGQFRGNLSILNFEALREGDRVDVQGSFNGNWTTRVLSVQHKTHYIEVLSGVPVENPPQETPFPTPIPEPVPGTDPTNQ